MFHLCDSAPVADARACVEGGRVAAGHRCVPVEARRHRRRLACRHRSIQPTATPFRPSVEQPLVFHVFGVLGWPDTLVVTEDDYFKFLIGVTSQRDTKVPAVVRSALGGLGAVWSSGSGSTTGTSARCGRR